MKKTICLVLFSLLFCTTNSFASSDLFQARIQVDNSAANANLAREQALSSANKNALIVVAKRLTTASGVKKLEALSNAQVENFIDGISIISEKSSSVRYIADLNISINEKLLKAYIQEQDLPLAVEEEAHILVIPVFKESKASKPLLWETENPWLIAWEGKAYKRGLSTFRSVQSSQANQSTISAEEAIALDGMALDKISRMYNTKDIYVLELTKSSIEGLDVIILSAASGSIETFHISGEVNSTLLEEAIHQITANINDHLKKEVVSTGNAKSTINIIYNYTNLKDWVSVEKSLKEISYIDTLAVDAISNGSVQFKIDFMGSRENLIRAINAKSLNLSEQGSIFLLEKI